MTLNRRRLLMGLGGIATLAATPTVAALLTPSQGAGPFYPREKPLDDDADLVQVAGREQLAEGEIALLQGRLLDRNGRPLTGVPIEIWQCDANGRYRHPWDTGSKPIDPGFQGFGRTLSDDQGGYLFRTIKPVPYPGRTPHIHVAVHLPGERPFTTQLYVANDARNNDDFLYRRIPAEQRGLVTAAFEAADGPGQPLQARWDVVLGVAPQG